MEPIRDQERLFKVKKAGEHKMRHRTKRKGSLARCMENRNLWMYNRGDTDVRVKLAKDVGI